MTEKNYGLVTSVEELASFTTRLLATEVPIGFDIETGYLGPDKDKYAVHPETAIIAGISFTNSTDWARYVPLAHDNADNVDNRAAARLLWPVLATGRGVAHNAPFEMRHLSRFFRHHLADDPEFGEAVRASNGYFPVRSDTMVEQYVAAEHQRFGLKPLVKAIFDHTMIDLLDLFPDLPVNKRKAIRFNVLDPHDTKVRDYACEDALWCLALHLRDYDRLKDLLPYRVDMALLPCLCEMEDEGVCYDWAFMRRAADELRVFRDRFNAEIMADLSELTGTTVAVNLASPPQVSDILYTKLGYKTTVYTASSRDKPTAERKMSTGKIALAALAQQYPVVKKIQQWKEMTRLLGTYLDRYEALYNYADDGRTHPSHLNAFVVTGRFAVSDPPYQQSPKTYHFDLDAAKVSHAEHIEAHGDKCTCEMFAPPPGTCFRFNFRDAIVAPPDHYILGFDLSQAELRAIAGEAKETALLKAFAAGEDVHTLTAALMLKVPVDQVTKEQRAIGKTFNFALMYGMGVKSLADRLAMTVDEAEALYNKYFEVYAGIAAWSAKQVQHGKRHGYVTSRFGRKLPIWEYESTQPWIYAKGDRACVNYPIQGGATGDYVRLAMVRARKAIRDAGLADKIKLVMNVHDALEWYVHASVLPQQVIAILQPAVVFPVPGWPPMQADWHIARRWGSPVDIDVTPDGRYLVKDKGSDVELAPIVEVDDESGEEIVVFPDTVVEAVRAIHTAPPSTVDKGKHVNIDLAAMPTADGYQRFLDLLDSRPGPNCITVRTPDGAIDLPHTAELGLADVGLVSLLLGPATVTYGPDDAATIIADDMDL